MSLGSSDQMASDRVHIELKNVLYHLLLYALNSLHFGHFSKTSDRIFKIPKGMHSYGQKLAFDQFPSLKAIKATEDLEKGRI